MGKFLSDIIWQIREKLITQNSYLFLRIYVWLFAPFFLIVLVYSIASGGDLIGMLLNVFFLSLICLPVSIMVAVFISKTGDSLIDFLYGVCRNEDHCEVIRNSELDKVIPLKEKGEVVWKKWTQN